VVKPATVEEYLAAVPEKPRAALERLRRLVREAAPEATEGIAWQMPAVKAHGRWLVGYAVFKDHCSFFPMSGALVEVFAEDLQGFVTTKGTIHFTPEQPLPAALVKKMVKARLEEVSARGA